MDVSANLKKPTKVIFGFLCNWTFGNPVASSESLESKLAEHIQFNDLIISPPIGNILKYSGQVAYHVYLTEPFKSTKKFFYET